MSRLLVSVRSAEEAQLALDEGVDLIDIKEPSQGSLGAADAKTIRAVVDRVARRAPLSAALGELRDPARLPTALARELRYLKLGLAGSRRVADWQGRWQREIDRWPPGVIAVAVAYADSPSAGAPDRASILRSARAVGCGAILLDTFNKGSGSLVDHLSSAELGRFIAKAHERGLMCVVAGSLRLADLATVARLGPDYVAVRGAVCRTDRTGRLDAARLRRAVAQVRRAGRPDACEKNA
jgi:(5-formylfuran-3-yl)methyl phosphate synthase